MKPVEIVSQDNISFHITNPVDCLLIAEFAHFNTAIPIPYDSNSVRLFLTFRSIFNKRTHKLESRFNQLTNTQQQSLIDISNFLGHAKLTEYITHLYYTTIYYTQLIPKFFTDM